MQAFTVPSHTDKDDCLVFLLAPVCMIAVPFLEDLIINNYGELFVFVSTKSHIKRIVQK